MLPRGRVLVVLLVAAVAMLFIGANAHLVYVATLSQPDCVAHLKPGESGGFAARLRVRSVFPAALTGAALPPLSGGVSLCGASDSCFSSFSSRSNREASAASSFSPASDGCF